MEQRRSGDPPGRADEQPTQSRSPHAFVSPLIVEADEVYRHELPQLLEERPGQWVAYHGSQRVGFAATKQGLYQVCRDRGLDLGETLVRCIEPEADIIFGPGAIWDIFNGPSCNPPDAFVSPLILEADEVFRREFPQLLEERPGQWVAYHGSQRVGFEPTKQGLYQVCRDRGLDLGETLVRCIEPEADIIFGPGAIWDIFNGQG